MSLACLAAAGIRVDLNHEDVVGKSYPGFWKDLQSAGFRCSFHVDKI
jgi:5-enolpyruvylshikimate-3-phosphate synthase